MLLRYNNVRNTVWDEMIPFTVHDIKKPLPLTGDFLTSGLLYAKVGFFF